MRRSRSCRGGQVLTHAPGAGVGSRQVQAAGAGLWQQGQGQQLLQEEQLVQGLGSCTSQTLDFTL